MATVYLPVEIKKQKNMKATIYKSNAKRMKKIALDVLMEGMRTAQRQIPVTAFRQSLDYCGPESSPALTEKLPVVIFGGVCQKAPGTPEMKEYNGIILVEINRLANRAEAEELRKRATEILQTLGAFIGSSGKSVKILTRFTLPDGTLPCGEEQIKLFHVHAYRRAAVFYGEQLLHPVTPTTSSPARGVRYTCDPGLYYNPDAIAIRMPQPLEEPEGMFLQGKKEEDADPLRRLMPGYERCQIIARLYNRALRNTLGTTPMPEEKVDKQPFLVSLGEQCFRHGVPEEDAVRWTLLHAGFRKFEPEVRETMRTCYLLGKNPGSKPGLSPGQVMMAQLEDFMLRRYEFRSNKLKGDMEYRERCSFCFRFLPVTDAVINTISMQAQKEGIELWDRDVKRFIFSTQTPQYNPLDDYLGNLPVWDGTDRIRALADSLPVKEGSWRERFYVWFLGMVAQWKQMDRMHGHSVVPLLVGPQGCGKSTWARSILPPVLREYYAESLDFSSKREAELALGRFALINLDEFDSISATQQAFLKHLLQKPEVKIRRPYSQSIRSQQRYGTFIATCNNTNLLTDPTGSRRFICIEINGQIDNGQALCYDQLYAQAIDALKKDERYWFTHDEEMAIMRDNLRFQQSAPEEQLFLQYYRQPDKQEEGQWLSATEILLDIQQRSGLHFGKTNMQTFGRILQKNGITRKHASRGNLWHVMKA